MTRLVLDTVDHSMEYVAFDGDTVHLRRKSDVTPTLERTQRARTEIDHAKAKRNSFQFIGSVDMTVALMWHQQYGIDIWDNSLEQQKRLLRLLNDPDWKLFKATDDTL